MPDHLTTSYGNKRQVVRKAAFAGSPRVFAVAYAPLTGLTANNSYAILSAKLEFNPGYMFLRTLQLPVPRNIFPRGIV
jgi:hypothetical protein